MTRQQLLRKRVAVLLDYNCNNYKKPTRHLTVYFCIIFRVLEQAGIWAVWRHMASAERDPTIEPQLRPSRGRWAEPLIVGVRPLKLEAF